MMEVIKVKTYQESIDGDNALILLNRKERSRVCEVLYKNIQKDLDNLNPYYTEYVEIFQKKINEDLDILMKVAFIRADITKRAQETYDKHAQKENTTPSKEKD